MGFCTNKLTPEITHQEGFGYEITVETGMKGLVRFNVACINEGNGELKKHQGADLTPAECRALAHMLLSTAELVEKN